MAYFKRFPIISQYEIKNRKYDTMDITIRTGIDPRFKNNRSLYIDYTVQDGESPIILADRLYDNGLLYWVILYFNDIINVDNEWPASQDTLEKYINRKYENPLGIHHYESIQSGAIVDSDWHEYDRKSISNFDYELIKNEQKRKIKIPTPEAMEIIVSEHNRLIA